MPDIYETIVYNYSGLSTDTKPSTAAGNNMLNGSRFREVDTTRTWIYNLEDDTWYLYGPAIDQSTHATTVIDYEHHEIHSGSHYYVSGFEIEATDGTIIFGLTTPDTTKWAHMTFDISGTSRTEMAIHEGATITGGAASTPFNNNRNSIKTSGLVLVKDPTISVAGTLIYAETRGLEGTNKVPAIGGGITRNREIILAQDETYTFTITSRDDDNHISYVGEFYEHIDKS